MSNYESKYSKADFGIFLLFLGLLSIPVITILFVTYTSGYWAHRNDMRAAYQNCLRYSAGLSNAISEPECQKMVLNDFTILVKPADAR